MISRHFIRTIPLGLAPVGLASLLWACGSEQTPQGEIAPQPAVITEVEEIAPPAETAPTEPAIEIPVEEPAIELVEEAPTSELEEGSATAAVSTGESFGIPLEAAEAAAARYEETRRRPDATPEEIQQAADDWEEEREAIMEQMTQGSSSRD